MGRCCFIEERISGVFSEVCCLYFIVLSGSLCILVTLQRSTVKEKVTGRRLGLQMFTTCVDFLGTAMCEM